VAGDLAAFAPPGDDAAFAAAIERTLGAPPDGAALREHAARFSWDAAASRTLAVYRRALAEAAG
jgi:glycosyltransferase involved in cell wall biosynthesis